MKVVIGSVVAALGASACCLGPVVFSIIGAGALGAASTRLEPLRPVFLGLTAVLLAAAFHATYAGQGSEACGPGERVGRRPRNSANWFFGLPRSSSCCS